jgi:hypothetical protein
VSQRTSSPAAYSARAEDKLKLSDDEILLNAPCIPECGACQTHFTTTFLKKLRMAKSKKNKNKAKLNLTVRDEQRNKLEQMASLENRSVSNLIEVMADERWKRLAEQQGIAP